MFPEITPGQVLTYEDIEQDFRPGTNAPWNWLIRLGITLLSRDPNSLVMTLYMTFQQEMGLKSEALRGLVTFGSTINFVVLMKGGMELDWKNCLTKAHTRAPVVLQDDLKKPLLKPSVPGDL